jgi:prepilin-type N-terminal cleavage/methylation domain-containing protein
MSKGFTLLELLVVISIISILVAMGAVAFSTAQTRGRDSKRRSDVQQMQKAFEQYYAQNGTYEACATMAVTTMPGGLPTDPKPGFTAYNTASGCDTTQYCVCALLEDTGAGNADAPTGTACNFGAGDYTCVSNLQ